MEKVGFVAGIGRVVALAVILGAPGGPAAAGGGAAGLRAVPFEFVGRAGDCGPGYPAGSRIVTAARLKGMGLPDGGGANGNPGDPADNPSKTDPTRGCSCPRTARRRTARRPVRPSRA